MKRIRVVQVITRRVLGGAHQVVMHLCERMDPARFDVKLVAGVQDEVSTASQVHRLPTLVREISPRRDLRALFALMRVVRGADLVHGHTYKAGVLSAIAARAVGVPAIVFTPHGHIFTPEARIPGVPGGGRLRVLRSLTRYAQSCAHTVTALSEEDLRDQVKHRLSPLGKYVVIRNGIEVRRFMNGDRENSRRRWKLRGSPLIGSVGRLTEEKGHLHLIPMLRRLPGAVLVIVGDGPEREKILAASEREGVRRRVVFLGETDSASVLPALDVYVQPSLYESQGLAILEAMAAGVPVVATRVGGVPGVVADGRTGLLVPPGDPEALAASVRRIYEDRRLSQSILRAAREQVIRDYSVQRMVGDYERLYLRLLRR